MQLWVVRFAPLQAQPAAGKKLRDLPAGTVVRLLDTFAEWKRIKTRDGITGWMKAEYLEAYIQNYSTACVYIEDIQTVITTDPEQYVTIDGYKQVNMCGELCCAYLMDMKLSDVLVEWKVKSPPFYKRIFGSGRARGTGAAELVELLGVFGWNSKVVIDKTYKAYTPHSLADLTGKFIASVNIDSFTGRLRGAGVLHWVVVTAVLEERTGYGWVELYNPFQNCIERYSWTEFVASARQPYGVVLV